MTKLIRINYDKNYLAIVLLAAMFTVTSTVSAAESKAGVVILAKGEFFAVNKNNEKRSLKRRSPVFPGDTLETGDESISQIRFIDNAVISLRPNTSLRIDEYAMSDNADKSDESSVISLLKGGFRTITGAINKSNYTVNSEVASIGVRGTTYEVVLDDTMYVGAWQGGVRVKTDGGFMDLGKGAAYNFAKITGSHSAPSGLLLPPKMLTPTTSPIFHKISQNLPGEYKNRPVNPVAFTGEKSVFNMITKKVNTRILTPADLTKATSSTQLPGATKSKDITNINLDRLGLLVISGTNKTKFFGGRASSGSSGTPVITDNGYGPHELPMFINATPNFAFWRNGSTVSNNQTLYEGTKEISFGKWDASAQPLPVMQVDPLGTAAEYEIKNPAYWITAQSTLPSVVNNKFGTAMASSVSNYLGSSDVGVFDTASANITLNFDTNAVNGNLSFGIVSGNSTWTINFAGAIKQNVLDVTVNTTTSTVTGGAKITGTLPMIFTGDDATGAAGAFDLEQIDNPNVHAEGVFFLQFTGG